MYTRRPSYDILTEDIGTIIHHFREILPEQWDEASVREAFEKMAVVLSKKRTHGSNEEVDLAKTSRASAQHFLRWALTGGRPGPSLMLTMSILGRDVSLRRIEDAATVLENMTSEANHSPINA